jgi:hypothetical protein
MTIDGVVKFPPATGSRAAAAQTARMALDMIAEAKSR